MLFVFVGAGVFLLVYNSSKKDLYRKLRKSRERAERIRSMNRAEYSGGRASYGGSDGAGYSGGAGSSGPGYGGAAGGGRRYVTTGRKGKKGKKEKYFYRDRNLQTLMPVYWEIATCVYFGFSFLTGLWRISWLIWILAGAVRKVIENLYGEPVY